MERSKGGGKQKTFVSNALTRRWDFFTNVLYSTYQGKSISNKNNCKYRFHSKIVATLEDSKQHLRVIPANTNLKKSLRQVENNYSYHNNIVYIIIGCSSFTVVIHYVLQILQQVQGSSMQDTSIDGYQSGLHKAQAISKVSYFCTFCY